MSLRDLPTKVHASTITCAVGDESRFRLRVWFFFVLFGVEVLCDIIYAGADISAVIKGEALFHIQLRLLFLCV